MFGQGHIEAAVYFGSILSIGMGLWIASSFEGAITSQVLGGTPQEKQGIRTLRALLWLTIGSLLALPFINLLGAVQSLTLAFLPQYAGTEIAGFAWGRAPYWLWAATNLIVMLIVYGTFLVVGLPRLKPKLLSLNPSGITPTNAVLAVLAIANVVWQGINMMASYVLRPEIPGLQLTSPEFGVFGFVGGWLVAISILAVLGILYSSRRFDEGPPEVAGQ